MVRATRTGRNDALILGYYEGEADLRSENAEPGLLEQTD